MVKFRLTLGLVSLLAILGCSTAPITPSIESFGESVTKIVEADNASARAKTLPERVNAQRRKDFAAKGVVYGTSDRGNCDYSRPDLETAYFDQVCRIVPQKLDVATDELVTVASVFDADAVQQNALVIDTANTDLLKEQLAFLLRNDLLRYSQQIAALSKATEPAEIGASASAAYTAFTGLGDAITRSEKVTDAKTTEKRTARATFISTLVTEALETYRYRLLKRIVEDADVFVRQASVQLAVLEFERESSALNTTNQRFIDGIDNQVPGSSQSLKAIEDRFAAMATADRKASFRRYADINTAHSAIVAALKSPGDLERLAEATSRIRALVDAVSALN